MRQEIILLSRFTRGIIQGEFAHLSIFSAVECNSLKSTLIFVEHGAWLWSHFANKTKKLLKLTSFSAPSIEDLAIKPI
jgi:hypothetical protein